jgi:hypothetical protein
VEEQRTAAPNVVRAFPQKLDKRVRLRKCNDRLRLPTASGRAEIVFTCQHEKHDVGVPHEHRGFVAMANQTFREFTLTWLDQGVADSYQEAKVKRGRLARTNRVGNSADSTRGTGHTNT